MLKFAESNCVTQPNTEIWYGLHEQIKTEITKISQITPMLDVYDFRDSFTSLFVNEWVIIACLEEKYNYFNCNPCNF